MRNDIRILSGDEEIAKTPALGPKFDYIDQKLTPPNNVPPKWKIALDEMANLIIFEEILVFGESMRRPVNETAISQLKTIPVKQSAGTVLRRAAGGKRGGIREAMCILRGNNGSKVSITVSLPADRNYSIEGQRKTY